MNTVVFQPVNGVLAGAFARQRPAVAKAPRGAIGGIPDQVFALGIGAIVLIAMIALGYKGFASSRTSTEMTNLNQLATGTKGLYSGSGADYQGTLTSVLISAKKAPQNMVKGTDTLINAWGGTVSVDGTGTYFSITYSAVPKDACIELIPKTPAEGFTEVRTGGGGSLTSFPIAVADAVAACSQTSNQITWTVQ